MSWATYIFPPDGSKPYIYQTMTDEEVAAMSQQVADLAKNHFSSKAKMARILDRHELLSNNDSL